MSLRFLRAAIKGLDGMPSRERKQMMERLKAIGQDPSGRHPGVIQMQGEPPGRFRLRQGDWRAVFVLEGAVVVVLDVAHRREVYR